MATPVAGELYESITGQLFEIGRQLRQPNGYPFDPKMLKRTLQAAIEGRFNLEPPYFTVVGTVMVRDGTSISCLMLNRDSTLAKMAAAIRAAIKETPGEPPVAVGQRCILTDEQVQDVTILADGGRQTGLNMDGRANLYFRTHPSENCVVTRLSTGRSVPWVRTLHGLEESRVWSAGVCLLVPNIDESWL